MSKRPSFVRMYPSDWRSGCLGLSLEQEGLYVRICMFIAETGRRVPLDDAAASRSLNLHIHQYRKVLGQLLMTGKVTRHDDGYGNHRAESEFEAAKRATNKHSAETGIGTDREADQGPSGQDCPTAADITPPVTRGVTTIVEAEKDQCFLRATKEPEPELESVCVSARGASAISILGNQSSDLTAGFEPLGHGALINCETIRHPNFTISIVAVKMDLALQCPGLDARQICSSAALQWAAEIEGGKSPRETVPANIRGAIVAGARMGHFRSLEHDVRKSRMGPTPDKPQKKTLRDILAERAAAGAVS